MRLDRTIERSCLVYNSLTLFFYFVVFRLYKAILLILILIFLHGHTVHLNQQKKTPNCFHNEQFPRKYSQTTNMLEQYQVFAVSEI